MHTTEVNYYDVFCCLSTHRMLYSLIWCSVFLVIIMLYFGIAQEEDYNTVYTIESIGNPLDDCKSSISAKFAQVLAEMLVSIKL